MPNSLSIVQSSTLLNTYTDLPYIQELMVTKAGFFQSAYDHSILREEGIDEYILIYCIDGQGWLGASTPTYTVNKGDIVLVKPHTIHTYGACPSSPWSILWIHFTGSNAHALTNHFRLQDPYFITSIGYQPQLIESFHHLIQTFSIELDSWLMLKSTTYLQHILCEIITLEKLSYKQQSHFKDIRQVISFMKNNLSKKLSLEDFASIAKLSKYHFSRKFKDYTGHTPLEYFNSLKIKSACDLLQTTDLNINEISQSLGFSTPYYFSEYFKQTTGHTPSHYRVLIRSKF
ncbi:MAG: helix-turn-helix domain-containing protein [Cellulosilyticaceae bacterium]